MTTNLTPANPTVACEQLTQMLGDYYKGTEDLKDYQARLLRADADQEGALSSQTLGDEEIAEEISKLISLKAVLSARIERKQADVARLTSELERLYPLASRELNALIGQEIEKRKALIVTKVTSALEIADDLAPFEAISAPAAIADLTQLSGPVRAITSARPAMYWGSPGDGPSISTAAGTLLANLEKFNELTK